MKTALVQLTSTEVPADSLAACERLVLEAIEQDASFILTPEVSNCIAPSKAVLTEVLCREEDDPFLARMRAIAAKAGVWVMIGSLGVKSEKVAGKFANRSFLISPKGKIEAKYDKIHMFDVDISESESYRESATYERGDKAVLAETDIGKIGMSICYDLRFPHLFRSLAQAGAEILTIPAAFAETTGQAHWHALLRARAIENGAYVIAPAQTGTHYEKDGKERRTYGHSLAVSPWGEVLVDAGTETGVTCFELDLSEVAKARKRVGSLTQLSVFEAPQ
ncbi:carbon-nitrogen hydrolase family protein [Lentibacter sp. XHP0401]|uniref:carbon-nitrogen hydrolase family protein n=1 Tax=Lentibacter sp. XHP0401 TaxID=2984334 RepID=UPI0021E85E9C|nr:carbon-nitrogen hydrolase family protein [Lentibacter sp. XHP0401]MCV2892534.1 carbon-nitrogen hydrolase family protein [Lentibacter sp. XHP0401]